jgi:hypothetical protein
MIREQPGLRGEPLSENTQRPPAATGCLRDPPGVPMNAVRWNQPRIGTLPMNTSVPDPSRRMKSDYLIKAPLSARMKVDETKRFRIPSGSVD